MLRFRSSVTTSGSIKLLILITLPGYYRLLFENILGSSCSFRLVSNTDGDISQNMNRFTGYHGMGMWTSSIT
jgi:hypothetical protein